MAALVFVCSLGVAAPRGPGSGPEEPTAEAAETKLDRTRREVADIVAECHARLPRSDAAGVGAAYARYSSKFQDSIADQVRTILEDAVKRRVFVPLEFVFYDLGVRGFKDDREGLNRLRECLRRKSVQVVLFFATNRLFRKTYRSLQFVEEQIVEHGVRAIFVKSGVDTADAKRWRSVLSMNAMMDEFVVGMNVDNIRAAHEGLLAKGLVFGTVAFGYRGEPVAGETTRRGRPRQRLAVDEGAAEYVRCVFRWYVEDRVSVAGIVRRLAADPEAPKPAKAAAWSRPAVVALLKNRRYRGCWEYGVTETVWVSSKDYARQVPRREPLKAVQLEEFRLVADEVWYRAQALLAGEAARCAGRKPRDPDAPARPRLVNGLFVCPEHGRKLSVGGPNGRSLVCKGCQAQPADRRPLYSLLPRDLALAKTCAAVASLVRADPTLADRLVADCQDCVARQGRPDATRVTGLEGRMAKLDLRVKFVLHNPGDTEADLRESEATLRSLRRERSALAAEVESARAASRAVVRVPTAHEVRNYLDRLAGVLEGAAAGTPESSAKVRELIDAVTGGAISLDQQGERSPKRGWLRGRFPNRVFATALREFMGVAVESPDGAAAEVVVDYRRDATDGVPAPVRELIVEGYHSGLLVKQLAAQFGLGRNRIATALDDWYGGRGEERPDGRSRRATLSVKHLEAPEYQRIADRVKQSADAGLLMHEVAGELGVDRNTVTSAWKYWHESRGLAVPDGRTRRKSLTRKNSSPPAGS